MKRKYKREFVSKIWPIFDWLRCCKCKEEFRREQGWTTDYHPIGSVILQGIDIYLCKSCAQSKTDAEMLFQKFAEERILRSIPPVPSEEE